MGKIGFMLSTVQSSMMPKLIDLVADLEKVNLFHLCSLNASSLEDIYFTAINYKTNVKKDTPSNYSIQSKPSAYQQLLALEHKRLTCGIVKFLLTLTLSILFFFFQRVGKFQTLFCQVYIVKRSAMVSIINLCFSKS